MMEAQLRHYADRLAYETDSWDLKTALEAGENVGVVDARSPEAYAREHIPGAINIPHRAMAPETTARLDQGRPQHAPARLPGEGAPGRPRLVEAGRPPHRGRGARRRAGRGEVR